MKKIIALFSLLLIAATAFSQVIQVTVNGKAEGINVLEIRTIRAAADGSSIIYYGDPPSRNIFAAETPANIAGRGCGVLFQITAREAVNGVLTNVPIVLNRTLIGNVYKHEMNMTGIRYFKPPTVVVTTNLSIASVVSLIDDCAPGADGDDWGDQVVFKDSTLTGNGTVSSPLKLAQRGATNGQVLKWNGTTWIPGDVSGGGGGSTDLSIANRNATTLDVASSSGTDATIPAATTSLSGLMTGADKTKVSHISVTQAVDLDAIEAASHAAVTVTDNARIDLTLTGQNIQAELGQQGASTGQVLKWNGSSWAPAADAGGDNWGSQVVITDSGLIGDGTVGNPLDWAGGFASSPLTGSGTSLAPFTVLGNSITASHIAADAIGASELGPNSVDSMNIIAGSIALSDLSFVPIVTVASDATIDGTGTVADPLKIGAQSASTGQVLKWNGSSWAPAADNTGGTPSLDNGEIFVGDVSNNAVSVPMSGDVSIDNTGATTVLGSDATDFYWRNYSFTGLGGSANNLSVNTVHVLSTTGAGNLTGISSAAPTGKTGYHMLINDGPDNITLKHESVLSSVGNRFRLPGGKDYIIRPEEAISLLEIGGFWEINSALNLANIDSVFIQNDSLNISIRNDGVPASRVKLGLHDAVTVTDNARIDLTLTGQNIQADLAQQGASTGQVLKWNGSSWAPGTDDGGSGSTNLSFTGASSPFTLNSDTGNDVTFAAGSNVTLTRVSDQLTIAATDTRPSIRENNINVYAQPTGIDFQDGFDAVIAGADADISLDLSEVTEQVQDNSWNVLGGAQTGIVVTYDDASNNVSFVATDASVTNEIQDLTLTGTGPYVIDISSSANDVTVSPGTGISLSESPANTLVITNSAPDQVVSLTNGGGVTVTGTYPNFTLTATDQSITNEALTVSDGTDSEALGGQTLTFAATGGATVDYNPATNVLTINAGSSSGGDNWGSQVVETSASLTGDGIIGNLLDIATGGVTAAHVLDNSLAAADLAVNVISSVDGVTNDGGNVDFIAGSGLTITPDDGANTVTFTNNAPDQVVALTAGAGISVTGTYPNFTITGTVTDTRSNAEEGNTLVVSNATAFDFGLGFDLAADATEADVTMDLSEVTEQVQDNSWNVLGGAQTGIVVTYNDASNNVSFVATDASATNEIQDLSLTGTGPYVIDISGSANDVTVYPGTGISLSESPANTLVITNSAPDQVVSLTNGGGVTVTGTYPNFTLTATDQSTTNEVVTVSDGTDSEAMGGQTLIFAATGGATVDYNPATNTLTINAGSSSGGDNWGTQVVETSASLTGDGIIGNLLDIATGGVTAAHVLDNSLAAADLAVNVISSVDGVTNDGGNVDFIAGSGLTITPDDGANTVTFTPADASATNEIQDLSLTGTGPFVIDISGSANDVTVSPGTGISLSESPANTLVITNSAPDQVVALTAGAGISVTGTYPNFTITGTVTDTDTRSNAEEANTVVVSNATAFDFGLGFDLAADATEADVTMDLSEVTEQVQDNSWNVLGGTQTGIVVTYNDASNNVSFVATDASVTNEIQDLTLTGTGPYVIDISGSANDVTVSPGTGISLSESPANTLVITNSAPDQTVVLTEGSGIDITGTYPNFTIAATGGGSSNYQLIRDDGSDETARPTMNFVSSSKVSAIVTDDVANTETEIQMDIVANSLGAGDIGTGAIGADELATGSVDLASGDVTGISPISKGGTGQSTATEAFDALSPTTTLGDISYNNGSDDVRLAGNTTTAKQFLNQTGNGTISAAPTWSVLVAADIPNAAGDVAGSYSSLQIQSGAVGTTEVADNSLAAADLAVNVVSSVEGVTNDGGNIDFVAGTGMSVSGDDGANTVTFTNSAPDQVVAMTAGAGISVSGTYPNFTITNSGDTDASNDITTSTSGAGDVTGTFPTLTVDGLQGVGVSASAPGTGQVLKYNGTVWAPGTDDSGGGVSGTDKQTIRFNGTTAEANSILRNDGARIGINMDPAIGIDLSVNGPVDAATYITEGNGLPYSSTASSSIRFRNTTASRFWYLGQNNDGSMRLYNDGPIMAQIINSSNQLKHFGQMIVGTNNASIGEALFTAVDSVAAETNAVVENKLSNSAANAKLTLKSVGGVADAYMLFANGANNFSLGIDGSLADEFVLSGATALGTNIAFRVLSTGRIGFGIQPVSSAQVSLPAGTTTVAPLTFKDSGGTVKTTQVDGDVEYSNDNLFLSNGATRFTIAKCLTYSGAINIGNTSDGDYSSTTVTVNGAADGDVVSIGVTNAGYPSGAHCLYSARVSAANTVEIRYHNWSGAASDPGAATVKLTVTKF